MTIRSAILAAALAGAALLSGGAASAETVSGVFNTGVAPNKATLSDGAVDTHYTVTGAGTSGSFAYSNGAYPNGTTTDAKYISPNATVGGPLTYVFKTSFDLTGYNLATVSMTLKASADDRVSINLNGMLNGAGDGVTGGTNVGSVEGYTTALTQFTVNTGFVAGLNTVYFTIGNNTPANASANPTALLVSGFVVTANRAVPGPIAGAGIFPLAGLAGLWLARRRKSLIA